MDTQAFSPIGGGSPVGQTGSEVKLFQLRGANLNVTTDQAFVKVGAFTRFLVTSIVSRALTGNALIAAGGIYTAAAKGGTAIVASTQAWAALSALDKVLTCTLPVLADVVQATPILSLTTAAGGASTADVFIYGFVLD